MMGHLHNLLDAKEAMVAAGVKQAGFPEMFRALMARLEALEKPIDMVLHCPNCGAQHIDGPERSLGPGNTESVDWTNPPHRTHLCHSCGHKWRPADVSTNGVAAVKTRGKDDSPITGASALRNAAQDVLMALEKASHGMYVDDAVPYRLVEELGKAMGGVK